MADSFHGRPAPPSREAARSLLTCDFTATTLPSVRHQVTRHARDNGLSDLALYRFVAAVNEIITNAVRHGGGAGHLHLSHNGTRLRCRITDRGTGLPVDRRHLRRPDPHDTSGRGLWLVHQTMGSVAIDTGPHGTTVTLSTPTAGHAL